MYVRIASSLFASFALALLFTASGDAQANSISNMLSELERVKPFYGTQISPDGQWVAWISSGGADSGTDLYLLHQGSGAAAAALVIPKMEGKHRCSGISWSPDSSRFAFLVSGASDQKQVYLHSVKTGETAAVTDLKGYLTDLRWSADGARVAFLFAANGGGAGPLAAVPAQTGAIGTDLHNQRLTVMAASGGKPTEISPANLNIYEFDWAPDGKAFVATAAPGPADNNWWTAQLYKVNGETGQMTVLYRPPAERQLAAPRWSPDGKQIAFIGGLMSDEGSTGGDLFAIHASGGEPRNLTSGRKSSPSSFKWQGKQLLFTEYVKGSAQIGTLDVANGQTEVLWQGAELLHMDEERNDLSVAADGRTSVVVRSTLDRAPEVWTGAIGDWKQVTTANAAAKRHWGPAKSITWQREGVEAQGWLIYPEHFDPQKRYPMITDIHGGPASMQGSVWPSARAFNMSAMAGLGYFVFLPNPRGSYGEGEAFTRGNVKDFGSGDLQDILAGIDQVLKEVPVDPERLGVTGWSYGGFMTMWTVTQTTRFHAAVAGAGIANWQSYYGENSIDQWMIPYFGASVYDDPAVYAKSSPISFIKQVKTPTLVIVGERDGECPAPQSFEFWHALQAQKVPTQLVVYPGEGHAFQDPKNRSDRLRRTLEWFDKYLGAANSSVASTLQ